MLVSVVGGNTGWMGRWNTHTHTTVERVNDTFKAVAKTHNFWGHKEQELFDRLATEGKLARRGDRWFFDYGDAGEGEEPLYRIGEHRFAVGEYVSITDEDGRLLTYKVTEVTGA